MVCFYSFLRFYAEHLAVEYAPKDTSRIVALRKLDAKAKLPASIAAYAVGLAATLVFGFGICLSTGALGNGSTGNVILWFFIGLIGMSGTGLNDLLYNFLLKKGKEKYAADVMALASQISKS